LLAVGLAYLLTVGWRLTPARVPVDSDPVAEFDLDDYLTHLYVRPGSAVVGLSVEAFDRAYPEVRILQVRRDGKAYAGPHSDRVIEAGDGVVVHGPVWAVRGFREETKLGRRPRETVTEETFESSATDGMLAKAVIPDQSPFVGETVAETGPTTTTRRPCSPCAAAATCSAPTLPTASCRRATCCWSGRRRRPSGTSRTPAIRRRRRARARSAGQFGYRRIAPLSPKTPVAVGILVSVVALAALNVLPIVIAALAGVVAMVVTGCLTTADAYDAVSWNVIFLLAGSFRSGSRWSPRAARPSSQSSSSRPASTFQTWASCSSCTPSPACWRVSSHRWRRRC